MMLRVAVIAIALGATALGIGAACTTSSGSGGSDTGCPQDLPATCTSAPSYDAAIAPLIQRRCLGCHGPGGIEYPQRDLSTYPQLFSRRGTALGQVYGCVMPPLDAGQLTSDERAALLEWFVCNAPNN